MVHDVKELYKSLRLPWNIIDPPPRLLSAAQMEERLRVAVRHTRDVFKEQMAQWIDEFGDDGDAFEVTDADLVALQQMSDLDREMLLAERYERRQLRKARATQR